MWDIPDIGYNIIPALILSYQFLPSVLKRCFAYCSLIPKDWEFRKDWLIELWMAENFLQVHQLNKGMKELGDQFFDDLLSRSFFQRSTREKESFVMHDLVNDLATYVSREFCLRSDEEEQANNISKMTRHISGLNFFKEGLLNKLLEATCKANKLRTFLSKDYHPSNKVNDLLCKCKCLHALSLCYIGDNLPDLIGNLWHLRYLKLNDSDLENLPDSICLLYNLQTLKLRRCSRLEELPSNMHRLVNLRHLYFEGTKIRKLPNGMGNLKKLEVLTSFYVGKCGEVNINQLGELLRLRGKLSIEKLQNVSEPKDAEEADLKNKIHLKKLWLRWDSNSEEGKRDGYEIEEDVLEKLQPPPNLKELSIEYYEGTKFPDWLGDMSINNIMSLSLIGCKYCVSLPPLGMLPSLKELIINGLKGIKSIGAEFYGNNNKNKEMNSHPHNSSSSSSTVAAPAPFRSLQSLRFEDMEAWKEWDWEYASSSSSYSSLAFPCLEELSLWDCPRLKSKLPQHLPSLLDLDIIECPQVVDTDVAFSLYLFPKLHQLQLVDCRKLERLDVGSGDTDFVSFPQTLFFPSLTQLQLWDCPKLASSPPFTLFPSLIDLKLLNCPEVEWPEPEEGGGGGFPSTLERLSICNCPKLLASHNKWDLHTLTSLTELWIQDEHRHNVDCKGWLSLPPNLKRLNGEYEDRIFRVG